MFKTLLVALALLTLGMLGFLYKELSDMRTQYAAAEGGALYLTLELLKDNDGSGKPVASLRVKGGTEAESVLMLEPGSYVIHGTEVRKADDAAPLQPLEPELPAEP